MGKKIVAFYFLALCFQNGFSQTKKDTIDIDKVVITGQFSPQSINKSLYKVEVITSADIQRMAQTNVADVLNQTLNILIVSDQTSGDSKANVLGMNGQYTKILVDNIPIVGDTGLGNDIDLTKLNANNVERIEIVKGSMGVEYGNNAVTGVINIITKKSSEKKWAVKGFSQEETVGKEYDWYEKGKGKHLQNLEISHNFSDKWFENIYFNRNDFQGFLGTQEGRNYFAQDDKRGYLWQPKEQWNPGLILRYAGGKTKLFFKSDYLNEEINFYNRLVSEKNLGGGERTYTSDDRDYFTTRSLQQLNIQSNLFDKVNYIGDFSYQKQERKYQNYIYDIPARDEIARDSKNSYYSSEVFYSRGTFNSFLKNKSYDLQVGYEGDITQGYAALIAGSFDGNNVTRKMSNIGIFSSAEFTLNANWFLRAGLRGIFSDSFKNMLNYSFVIKNKINPKSEFRASIGSANRFPTFDERFTYFVDSNHDVRGNEDLKPEKSYTGSLFYTLRGNNNGDWKWAFDANSLYLQVENRIDLILINDSPLQYKYINLNFYQTWLNSASFNIKRKNAGLNFGVSYIGTARDLGDESNTDSKFYYTFQGNASTFYTIPKTKTTFSLNYKFFGKSFYVSQDNTLGITQNILTKNNSFSLMDFSIVQKFWNDHFDLTAGIRNIFDISQVNGSVIQEGAHGTTSDSFFFYGRSYFARLGFNF